MAKPRGVLIAGNWKMNHGPKETAQFFSELGRVPLAKNAGLRACILPPAVSLAAALDGARTASFPIEVGAQSAHWEKKGAFTGELSGPLLQEIGVHTVLVGHSERRQYFGETDETARKRSESLAEQGFTVVLCIGETRPEREQGRTEEVLIRQLHGAIVSGASARLVPFLDGRLVIAYEPVWAIGTGLTATPAQAEEAHQIIRKDLWDRFGMEAAGRTSILYGGSVTPENIDSLLSCPNVDGGLVGGASLKAESFLALLRSGARAI